MKRRSYFVLTLFSLFAVAALIGYKTWNKPFSDPLDGNAIKVNAIQLFSDFSTDEKAAQKKYVPQKVGEKIIEVSGEIQEVGKNADGENFYILKTSDETAGVKCIMNKGDEIVNAKAGNNITIRGFCDGYNLDVIVNRCKPVQ